MVLYGIGIVWYIWYWDCMVLAIYNTRQSSKILVNSRLTDQSSKILVNSKFTDYGRHLLVTCHSHNLAITTFKLSGQYHGRKELKW